MRLVHYVVVLVLIAAGVWVSTRLAPRSAGNDVRILQERLDALDERTASSDPQEGIASLEARVAALEGAPIRAGAPAPEAWSDADVSALRAGLEKVKVAERHDREAQRIRQVVSHIVPDAEPAQREETVALLLEAIQGARASPERAEALRDTLLTKLRERFPEEIATRMSGLVPGGEPSEGPR